LRLQDRQRVGVIGEALEAAQLAEGLLVLDDFLDDDVVAGHLDRLDVEFGLLVVLAETVEQVIAGGQAVRHGQLAEAGARTEELGGGLGEVCKRLHEGALGFVELVEHRGTLGTSLQCNISMD